MKTRARQGFWSQRPLPAARSLEFACWLAAAVLVLALVLVPLPRPSPVAQTVVATAPAPHWTIYQQHCIERILSRAANKTEEYVAGQINQLCIAPFRGKPAAAAGSTALSCEPLFSPRLTLMARPVAGCLGG